VHVPRTQVFPPEHALSQAPQCRLSVDVSTHVVPHAVNVAAQLKPQRPRSHKAWARATLVVHDVLQSPQCIASDCKLAQLAPHKLGAAAGQPETHTPSEHIGMFAGHSTPQRPQFAACVTSVSQPVIGSVEQCAQPLAQLAASSMQVPAEQFTFPATLGSNVQSRLHAPQLRASLATHSPSHAS